ncbi:hypothetical protein LG329_09760 [Virgibacillus necropolis]|uniref:hypothetical protein n=1 Tax=Virgibacillus necropolis TaxID=163877 RepID=UPI0038502FBE
MDSNTKSHVENLQSDDKNIRYEAFTYLKNATKEKVEWAYEVWDSLMDDLTHKDNHRRAIATQLLCNLAKSDPENRMLKDFPAILAVTKDKRFVTARHTLQALWKVGTLNSEYRKMVVESLEGRYKDCVDEKNCTLIRYDIIQGLRKLFDEVKVEEIKIKALELIELEEDPKYQKKYSTVWKKV